MGIRIRVTSISYVALAIAVGVGVVFFQYCVAHKREHGRNKPGTFDEAFLASLSWASACAVGVHLLLEVILAIRKVHALRALIDDNAATTTTTTTTISYATYILIRLFVSGMGKSSYSIDFDDETTSFDLTRTVFLKALAAIYAVAFTVAYLQAPALIGPDGLYPGTKFIANVRSQLHLDAVGRGEWEPADAGILFSVGRWLHGSAGSWFGGQYGSQIGSALMQFDQFPSIFQFQFSDEFLRQCALTGLLVSAGIVFGGNWACNGFSFLIVWVLYQSIVQIGQLFYGFGWEMQLLETGFLAVFAAPWSIGAGGGGGGGGRRRRRRQSGETKRGRLAQFVDFLYMLLGRWIIFRIMIGAGFIKIRGDVCWRDLTCLEHHYLTQPIPNRFSVFFHHLPAWFHQQSVMVNHIVELILPWLLLSPFRPLRLFGGVSQVVFQLTLIASGNLSFLNWLTIVPCLCCLDNRFLLSLVRGRRSRDSLRADQPNLESSPSLDESSNPTIPESDRPQPKYDQNEAPGISSPVSNESKLSQTTNSGSHSRRGQPTSSIRLSTLASFAIAVAFFALIVSLSLPIVKNLASEQQAMNRSFDRFHLVNTYGAFGSVGRSRTEVIVEVTNSTAVDDAKWYPIEFPCKPGDPHRRPCWISPYHLRVDWQLWFAAFQSYEQNPWLIHLMGKIARNDSTVAPLLSGAPSALTDPGFGRVTLVRATHYQYGYPKIDEMCPGHPVDTNSWWVNVQNYVSCFFRVQFMSGGDGVSDGVTWWKRRPLGTYAPQLSLESPSVRKYFRARGWKLS